MQKVLVVHLDEAETCRCGSHKRKKNGQEGAHQQ